MADQDEAASLKLRVDTTSVAGANRDLSDFQRSARDAGGAARDYANNTDQMTRSIQQMLMQQRETNQLLSQTITLQRQGTQSIDDHISSLTRLSAGINAASLAYDVFGRKSAEASAAANNGIQQQIAGYQQLAATLDQLASRLAAVNSAARGGIFSGTAPTANGYGAGFSLASLPSVLAGGVTGSASLDPSIIGAQIVGNIIPAVQQVLTPQLQAIYTAIQAQSLRNALPASQLIQGMNLGTQAGVGPTQGADMVIKMQQAMQGFGDQAEFQRQTLQAYGVTTKDATEALRQFITTLSGTRDGLAKTQAAQQFGIDPGILTRTTAAQLNPIPGSQADLQQQQARRQADLEARNAELQDAVQAMQLQQTRTLFGALPSTNVLRSGPDFSPANYEALRQNLDLQIAQQTSRGMNGQNGSGFFGNLFSTIGQNATSNVDLARLYFDRMFGLTPGADIQAVGAPGPGGAPQISPVLRQQQAEFEMSLGRLTPQGISAQVERATRRGQDIVQQFGQEGATPEQIAQLQKDQADALKIFAERLNRAADPVGEFTQNLERANAILGLPENQRAQQAALLAAEQANLARTGSRTLSADQQGGILAGITAGFVGRGEAAGRTTREQIDQNNALAKAYEEGGRDVQQLTAAYQAQMEVQKGVGTAAGETNRAFQLLTASLSDMELKAQQNLQRLRESAVAAGNVAAAGGNPVSQREAELRNQAMGPTGVNYNERYQTMFGAGDFAGIAKLNQELDQAVKALQDAANSNAAAQRSRTTFQSNQTQNILGGGGGGASLLGLPSSPGRRPNLTYGNEPVLSDILAHGAETLPPGYTVQANEGYNPDPNSHVRNSAHHVGNAIDVRIVDPNGQPITNTGADTTGMYGALFRGSQAYQQQAYPVLNGYFRWGGVFGANGGRVGTPGNPADDMHYDIQGFQGLVGGGQNTPGNVVATSDLAQRQAILRATTELQGQGAYTQADVQQRAQQILNEQVINLGNSMKTANDDISAQLPLEKERAAAILAGGDAQKVLDDQIKIEAEQRKLLNAGMDQNSAEYKALTAQLVDNTNKLRAFGETAQVAQVVQKQLNDEAAAARAKAAFQSGGLSGMQLQESSEGNRAALVAAGVPPEQAQQLATQWAQIDKSAQDYKEAVTDASNNLANLGKGAVSDIVNGLTEGIGKAHGFRYAMEDAALSISKLGLQTFATQPLQQLVSNVFSGKGFNFNVGSSGLSTTAAMGQALEGGLAKSLGIGHTSGEGTQGNIVPGNTTIANYGNGAGGAASKIVDNGGDLGSNFGADLFGGNNSLVGKGLIKLFGSREDNATGEDLTKAAIDADPTGRGGVTAQQNASQQNADFNSLLDSLTSGDAQSHHTGGRIYHDGSGDGIDSLKPDEVPAILQTGEMVLSRNQVGAFDKLFPGGPGAMMTAAANYVGEQVGKVSNNFLDQMNAFHEGRQGTAPLGNLSALGALGFGGTANVAGPMLREAGAQIAAINAFRSAASGASDVAAVADSFGMNRVPTMMDMASIRGTQAAAGAAQTLGGMIDKMGTEDVGALYNAAQRQLRGGSPYSTPTYATNQPGMRYDPYAAAFVDAKGNQWYHSGGMVRLGFPQFDDGGSVDADLNSMLQASDKSPPMDWSSGVNLGGGGGGTQSGVGPGVGKETQSPGNAMFASLATKAIGAGGDIFKSLFGDNGQGGKSGGLFSGLFGSSSDSPGAGPQMDSFGSGNLFNPTGTQLADAGGDTSGSFFGFSDPFSFGEGPLIAHNGARVTARRFHDGGVANYTMPPRYTPPSSPPPAIATGATQPNGVTIHQNIYTPDANSFRASADQVAATSATAQARAMRIT